MWTAASMSTRSVNLVHITGLETAESGILHQLDELVLE